MLARGWACYTLWCFVLPGWARFTRLGFIVLMYAGDWVYKDDWGRLDKRHTPSDAETRIEI